ncbi:MAG TPA: hypothetical protein VIU38_06150 [Anaerolineales bacterium]
MSESAKSTMQPTEKRNRILALLGLIAVVLAAYFLWARPYQFRWGATEEEVKRTMPGDELAADPTFLATRAITINGTPQQIWPWLMQMGYGRAGFYGYDILDNGGQPSAERIWPQYQDYKVGDAVPMMPSVNLNFAVIEPYDAIVWRGTGSDVFTWALYPLASNETRFVSRVRWSYHWSKPWLLPFDVFAEFTDHLAVRKLMQGVRDRAEGHIQPTLDTNIEFFIYVGTFLAFVWAARSVLRLPLAWTSWLVGVAGGLAWLLSWYGPVSLWTGALLSFLVIWAVRVEFRDAKRALIQEELRDKGHWKQKR